MLKPLVSRILNHLVNQNSWARSELLPFVGKSVHFAIPPLNATLIILENGGLAIAGETAGTEATVTISFSAAVRLLADDESARSQIHLEGDTELAATLAKVIGGMSWQYEEDLSQVIGDIPAHQISEFGRQAAAEIKAQSLNVAQMLTEYWQEEQPILAKKRHIESFVKQVDTLRDDTERLTKRMQKLEAKALETRNTASVQPEKSGR